MVSGSDRHASRWHHGFRIPGAAELTLDRAYRAMIWLGEEIADGRTTTDAIEEDLYRRRQELFGEVSIAFFDTTSLYFEGAGGQTLGQLGHMPSTTRASPAPPSTCSAPAGTSRAASVAQSRARQARVQHHLVDRWLTSWAHRSGF